MKISNMAFSNVKGNLYRYIMYYLSNSFAVTAFFIFSNFVFHPSLKIKNIGGSSVSLMGVVNSMIACQVIIVIFSILFVSYSTSIFLKSRGKEFGLLSLYGMTNKQIKKYVFIENTIISAFSIVTGILSGVVFSKLFLMAMEAFMDINLPFNISFKSLGLTILVFFVLFETVSILMLFKIRNKEIIQQIKSSKIPKEIPQFSKIKSILGVGLLVLGYGIAWIVKGAFVPLAMLPVIFIVIIGTYFTFTQFSIAIANRILKSKDIIYKKTNLISYSQMIFKLQDTAKVLFAAAILGAITFTATETIYSFFTEIASISGIDTPEDIAIIRKGETIDDIHSIDRIKEILEKHDLKTKGIYTVKNIWVKNEANKDNSHIKEEILIMSNTDYNKLAVSQNKEKIIVKENEAVYNFPYEVFGYNGKPEKIKRYPLETAKLSLNGEVREYKVNDEIHHSLMALGKLGYFDAFILNDKDYNHLLKRAKEDNIVIYNGIKLDNWKSSFDASVEIRDMLGDKYQGSYYAKSIPYKDIRNNFGLTLFIGFFIAFLFFIASGSIIYFKLFNEVKQDKVEYDILRKIGATENEINKIITKQIGIIFFLPFVVSTTHSLFALKSLSNLLEKNLFTNGLVVAFGYLVFQMIYFIIIRIMYIRKVKYN
ncbi:ABC transporter permease [Tissierella praeacuta]|uniref:Putative ABC transport system permease protein n=1 Tax=Tissierella praeacuta DSM 18095 TaxID=1123404 RepID=A0A1M4XN08_9FIRM|nr:ABC transporter permease [Tissierella praeacuta]MBU5256038.1 ABC transporter permease [Tissierella praeacuta]SHE94766.1 putative ABC transport system permease protein [Tissierella praeacuta DSM 18095]SUO99837.1 FtsX-like permease family [Tissierella praeacuta]